MSTILVVEDESIIAADISRVLTELGYVVLGPVATSEDALRIARSERPSMVLMDIRIQGELDGIETAARMRSEMNVPIVYLTSHSDDATLERAKQTAPHGFLLKPFEERGLRVAIEVALGKHKLEGELAERDRWFSTTLQSIGDAVIAVDREQRITFVNGVAAKLTGWTHDAAIGRPLGEVFRLIDQDGQPFAPPIDRVVDGGFTATLPANVQLVTRTNEQIEVDDTAAPIVGDDGRLLGGVVVFRDITEQRRMRQQIERTERLASIGTLAAGMAHEINNPLTAVMSVFDLVRELLAEAASAAEQGATARVLSVLREINELTRDGTDATTRVARIVRGLRQFGSVRDAGREVLDLPDVLAKAMKLTRHRVRDIASVRLELSTTPFVLADEGRLVQVVTNLIINAAQAMPAPDPSRNDIRITTRTSERGWAVVEVHDNGSGVSPRHRARLFEPFFTTKPVGEGMGLGLSIAHGIVQSFGGEIEVDSPDGSGTIFRVSLPPVSSTGVTPIAPRTSAPSSAPRARVLVVDDDMGVAKSVARLLGTRYSVEVQHDPQRALARLLTEPIDLVLSDVVMPGMTGVQLLARLREVRPALARRFILMTGGVLDPRDAEHLEDAGVPVLPKPMPREVLLDAVAARLAAVEDGGDDRGGST